ncbi:MAG: hypothetical protein ACLFQS_05710 [Bacteroidales bacterium]
MVFLICLMFAFKTNVCFFKMLKSDISISITEYYVLKHAAFFISLTFFLREACVGNNFLFNFGLNKNKQHNKSNLKIQKLMTMKKYFLTSIMSLFIIAGTSLLLTATEKDEKAKTECSSSKVETTQASASDCCSSKAKATQTASVEKTGKSDCGDKATQANQTDDVEFIQTANTSEAKSECTSAAAKADCGEAKATTTAAQSECSGSKATTTASSECSGAKAVQTASAPGECSKVPSGVSTQQASNDKK